VTQVQGDYTNPFVVHCCLLRATLPRETKYLYGHISQSSISALILRSPILLKRSHQSSTTFAYLSHPVSLPLSLHLSLRLSLYASLSTSLSLYVSFSLRLSLSTSLSNPIPERCCPLQPLPTRGPVDHSQRMTAVSPASLNAHNLRTLAVSEEGARHPLDLKTATMAAYRNALQQQKPKGLG
jgi:hypothetical protein